MFSADGNYISQDSKDIFEKYELIDLDSTPQGFGERETDFSPTYEWVKSRIKKTSKTKIIIHKKGEIFGLVTFKEHILDKILKDNLGKEIILVFNDYQKFDLSVKLVYDLSWWSDVISQNLNNLNEIKNIKNKRRTKLFLSRNNKRKSYREKWIEFLENHDLKKDGYVSEVWNRIYLEKNLPSDININGEINYDWTYNNDFNLFDKYQNVFCEVITESGVHRPTFGHWTSEKTWRPFLFGVIPMIISFKDWDFYLKDAGFDLFEDVIDTSFYHTTNLHKKFMIIKENFKIIRNKLTKNGRFRDDIFKRLKNNQNHFLNHDNYVKYLIEKIDA